MNKLQGTKTEPAIQREPFKYPAENLQMPQYIGASCYYMFSITLTEEATDEEFFLAAISGPNYKSWLEEEDIIDHSKRKPL